MEIDQSEDGKSEIKHSDTGDDISIRVQSAMDPLLALSREIESKLKLLQERERKWQEYEKILDAHAKTAKEKIVLEVGGQRFATTKNVLLSSEDSYFSALLRTGHWKPDKDGVYFIDRSPKYFGIILDFLRYGEWELDGLSAGDLRRLSRELDYYQIATPEALTAAFADLENATAQKHPSASTLPNDSVTLLPGGGFQVSPQTQHRNLFNANTSDNRSSGLFGTPNPPGGLFGQRQPLFGAPTHSSGNLFGPGGLYSRPSSTPFGAPTQNIGIGGFSNPAPTTGTLFGAPTQNIGIGGFGNPAPTTGGFGNPAPTTGTLFGASQPSAFGSNHTQNAHPVQTPAVGGFSFGTQPTTSGLFGHNRASLFGSHPQQTSGGGFGSTAPANTTGGGFGTASVLPVASSFGSAPTTTTANPFNRLFGSTHPIPAPSGPHLGTDVFSTTKVPTTTALVLNPSAVPSGPPFQPVRDPDSYVPRGENNAFQSITAMPAYERQSFEELRWSAASATSSTTSAASSQPAAQTTAQATAHSAPSQSIFGTVPAAFHMRPLAQAAPDQTASSQPSAHTAAAEPVLRKKTSNTANSSENAMTATFRSKLRVSDSVDEDEESEESDPSPDLSSPPETSSESKTSSTSSFSFAPTSTSTSTTSALSATSSAPSASSPANSSAPSASSPANSSAPSTSTSPNASTAPALSSAAFAARFSSSLSQSHPDETEGQEPRRGYGPQ
eukprot:TRINITY_DN1481_c0_g2_i3.p1 TRINITY_DN1481_c0_g2~~TRINITY_DN1481_c0_g2_i3.p1  ORF type:complete len:744 (+),score=119.44 TRINITY_DN1481_c0_g2_i3:58-2232(+)